MVHAGRGGASGARVVVHMFWVTHIEGIHWWLSGVTGWLPSDVVAMDADTHTPGESSFLCVSPW